MSILCRFLSLLCPQWLFREFGECRQLWQYLVHYSYAGLTLTKGLSALALQSGSNPDRSRFDPVRTRHAKIVTGSNPDSLDPHTRGSFNWIQLDRSGIIVGAVSCHGTASVYARICCVFLGKRWRLAGVLTKPRLYWESGALLMSKVSWMG